MNELDRNGEDSSETIESGIGKNLRLMLLAAFLGILFLGAYIATIHTAYFADEGGGLGTAMFYGLMFSPFLLLGLVGVAATVSRFMALINPRARLTVSSTRLRVGETIDVSWKLFGRISIVEELEIALHGFDERDGSIKDPAELDLSNFDELFEKATIFTTTDPATISQGETRWKIPSDVKLSSDEMKWRLRLRAKIKRWPDTYQEFAVQVLPSD